MGHQSATDVLLKEVGEAFRCYADKRLRPLLRDSEAEPFQKELAARLLLLQWRSRDSFGDFGEFFCMRLLLDQQSALASYFLDLFAQLEWILHLLMLPGDSSHDLPRLVHRIAATCRLLYAAHMSRQDGFGSSGEGLKRVGQTGRMFSQNKLHCRMRQLGFVNLDQPGKSVVSLKEELGRGAFATVYKGVFEADYGMDPKKIVGDPVAVKVFSNCSFSDSSVSFGSQLLQSMTEVTHHFSSKKKSPEWMEEVEDSRLAIELGRLVSVRHPNIVTPRGYIGKRSQLGECGLVMEIMNESLHDYLQKVAEKQVRPFGELEMLDLMLEIAQGMRFLHECNLMHRDLKPRNVLLRYNIDTEQDLAGAGGHRFEVKLADFGLTKLYSLAEDEVNGDINKATHTAPVGTSCYMAPELRGANAQTNQIHEEKLDIFSYGTTCFNILIGNPDAMAFAERTEKKMGFCEAVKTGRWMQALFRKDLAVAPSNIEGFYAAVETGRWKQWPFPYKDLGFIVTLIGRCWETDPNKRPTFATLCLLLQHRLRCSPSFAKELSSCMKDYRTWLKEVLCILDGLDSNTTWLSLWNQIENQIQNNVVTKGSGNAGSFTTRVIMGNIKILKDVYYLEVVRMYLQAGKNVDRWPEVDRELFDHFVETSHPLITTSEDPLIKREGLFHLLERERLYHFYKTSEDPLIKREGLIHLLEASHFLIKRKWLNHLLEGSESGLIMMEWLDRFYGTSHPLTMREWLDHFLETSQSDLIMRKWLDHFLDTSLPLITRKWLDHLLETSHPLITRKWLDHFFETSEALHPLITTREWLDHFFERSHSLILIKGEFCISILKRLDHKIEDFHFENDEARSCLQADASLFPLLVNFWNLKNF